MFINIPIFPATFVCTFDDERAPRSNAKLVELQFRSFVEPFRPLPFRTREDPPWNRLKRAHGLISIGGRAIEAECTAHCCAEHCRCAGGEPCYRSDTLSRRINLCFSSKFLSTSNNFSFFLSFSSPLVRRTNTQQQFGSRIIPPFPPPPPRTNTRGKEVKGKEFGRFGEGKD